MTEIHERRDERGFSDGRKKRYEQPEIAWEEEYKPTAFGISCFKQPGNPGCIPGPTSA